MAQPKTRFDGETLTTRHEKPTNLRNDKPTASDKFTFPDEPASSYEPTSSDEPASSYEPTSSAEPNSYTRATSTWTIKREEKEKHKHK